MGAEMLRLVGIAGSLRRASYNRAALRVAQDLVPSGTRLDSVDLAEIPVYNEDLRIDGDFPPPVAEFRRRIGEADGLLIVTPEYNYSIPGPLKNAIDWASRPPDQPFDGKPIAIMGASPSMLGTARAQYHLRQCFVYLNGMVLNRPEVMIAAAHGKFDEQGRLLDDKARQLIGDLVAALVAAVLQRRRA